MTKEEKSIEFLDDMLCPYVDLHCSKCNKRDTVSAFLDDYDCARHFYALGWRGAKENTYCPDCAKKYKIQQS